MNKPTVFQQQLNRNSTQTQVAFDISDTKEARLQIQFRMPLTSSTITLIDPSGHVVVKADNPKIIILNRKSLNKPSLGDQIFLPEQLNPKAGTWRLTLTHSPARGDEHIIITTSLLERFLVNLSVNTQQSTVGQLVILSILAMDNGHPVKNLSPHIKLFHNDKPISESLIASESATAESGINLSDESSTYRASYIPAVAGTYLFTTELEFPGRSGSILKKASRLLTVTPSLVSLNNVRVHTEAASTNCIKKIEFIVELSFKEPGTYTTSLFLNSQHGQDLELSATQQGGPGILTYRIPLPAKSVKTKKLGELIDEIKRIEILRFENTAINLLDRYSSIPIQPPVSLHKLCQ